MRPAAALMDTLDDLELLAEGLYLADREATVADLVIGGYAEVDLGARLHAAIGVPVRIAYPGSLEVSGVLLRAGAHWALLATGTGSAIALTSTAVAFWGLGPDAVAESARPLGSRLSAATALRALAEAGPPCAARLAGGVLIEGAVRRVGADFVELETPTRAVVVPIGALAIMREVA